MYVFYLDENSGCGSLLWITLKFMIGVEVPTVIT